MERSVEPLNMIISFLLSVLEGLVSQYIFKKWTERAA